MKNVNINAIRIDGGTQARASLNESIVAEYADNLAALPPIILFYDGSDYWLADGFHRYHAYRRANKASIAAGVREGTCQDAKLFAAGANGDHGLRRTNEDKRRAVEMVLGIADCDGWSDTKIANHCAVSVPFVSAIRRPEVAEKQQQHRKASAEKKAPDRNPITPLSKAGDSKAPKSKPKADPPIDPSETQQLREQFEEQGANLREVLAENEAMGKIVEADDKLAAAVAEIKRLTELVRVLEERNAGLMNEKNAAIRSAKSWQRKAEAAERAAA